MDCASCGVPESAPRWKAPLLFVGTLLICPCHLPVTFGILAAAGAGLTGVAWLLSHKALVYGIMSAVYIVALFFFLKWALRARDREREIERAHAAHTPQG